jgi:hypothetical protein
MQPPDAFEKAAENLPARGLGEQGQGDDVINHYMGREVSLTLACFPCGSQGSLDAISREHPRHDTKRDVIGNPASTFE